MSDISIIGGITVQIEGNPYGKLEYAASNPGKISMKHGGTGRNIAENLAGLGADVAFVSAAGDDFAGRGAVIELKSLGVDTSRIQLLEGENTATSLEILNIVGDTEVEMCNVDVLKKISPEFLSGSMGLLKQSKLVAVDCNLTEEALNYIAEELSKVPLFLDPVSVGDGEKVKKIIGRFHTVKPNRMEAEAICGLPILSENEMMAAGQWFADRGVKRIFITMGAGGVYYKEGFDEGILRPEQVCRGNTAGAGDAFSAAIIHGFVRGMSVREIAEYGMAVAESAIKSQADPDLEMGFGIGPRL